MSNLYHDNNLLGAVAGVRLLLDLLGAGRPVVAATCVARDGAAALRAGSKLFVDGDGRIAGGAEGGLLEQRVAAWAAPVLASGKPELFDFTRTQALTAEELAVYGHIGQVFLERIDPDQGTDVRSLQGNVRIFEELKVRLAKGQASLLLSALNAAAGAASPQPGRCLLWPGGLVGSPLPDAVLLSALRQGASLAAPVVIESEEGRFFLEPYLPQDAVYIAGAGKVSRILAPLAVLAGFRVVVMDVDAAFANRERFPEADEVLALPTFDACFKDRPMGAGASVVVATRGHAYDREVLAQALHAGAGYVGMMGCKADGRARLDQLGQGGVSREALESVHTPIGLPIGGASPEETAMSIVAELILARTGRRKRGGVAV
jgi:xanthine dehydrogenase accessory factor